MTVRRKHVGATLLLLLLLSVVGAVFYGHLGGVKGICSRLAGLYHRLSDRKEVRRYLSSFGVAAPMVYMGAQALQVLLAPIPGEATGFIGGYLFGAVPGFFYSTLGLTVGSGINFAVGRILGGRYVSRIVPAKHLLRFDLLLRREGALVALALFLLPGFPKDYLCLFLGMTSMPARVFLILSTVGRMPGTFVLSLQGAQVFEGKYGSFLAVLLACVCIMFVAYFRRSDLYGWIERINRN